MESFKDLRELEDASDYPVLYHSAHNKEEFDSILEKGILTNWEGLVYLAADPFRNKYTFEVRLPKPFIEKYVHDWKEFWCDENGEEIDYDHSIDEGEHWFVSTRDIPVRFIKEYRD